MKNVVNQNDSQMQETQESIELIKNSQINSEIKLPKIALIADVENWAFHNIAKQIVKHLSKSYEFEIFYHGNYPEIELLMYEVKDFDLIHFFWRDALFSLLSDHVRHSFDVKGNDYYDFITNIVAKANITTSIYDHLLLSESQIQERVILFNALTIGYTTCSNKLNSIYSNFNNYPNPYGNIEDGVDIKFFAPNNLERLSIKDKEIVVGWVGNSKWGGDGVDHKGLTTIIKPAVESLRKEGYNIRGYYADRQERWIPHNEMSDYYNSIDICICASDIEGTPNPALESMACGVPVISTNVGIIPQIFGTLQNGYILSERSIEDLKIKLKDLVENPQKRVALSKENLKEIRKWTWENQCQKFDDFFKKMLFVSQEKYIKELRNKMRKQMLEMYLNSHSSNNLEIKLEEFQEDLETKLEELKNTNSLISERDELKNLYNQMQLKINLMEQSKFWKIRNEWFKIKKKFGFSKDKY